MTRSLHQLKVDEFMQKAGQYLPQRPTVPNLEVRKLRAKLILEEALETIWALGFETYYNNMPAAYHGDYQFIENEKGCNPTKVLDGCCDIKVVTTGTLSAFGIDDEEPQAEVDESNLKKFGPGGHKREDGKWIKPNDWVEPNLKQFVETEN